MFRPWTITVCSSEGSTFAEQKVYTLYEKIVNTSCSEPSAGHPHREQEAFAPEIGTDCVTDL